MSQSTECSESECTHELAFCYNGFLVNANGECPVCRQIIPNFKDFYTCEKQCNMLKCNECKCYLRDGCDCSPCCEDCVNGCDGSNKHFWWD